MSRTTPSSPDLRVGNSRRAGREASVNRRVDSIRGRTAPVVFVRIWPTCEWRDKRLPEPPGGSCCGYWVPEEIQFSSWPRTTSRLSRAVSCETGPRDRRGFSVGDKGSEPGQPFSFNLCSSVHKVKSCVGWRSTVDTPSSGVRSNTVEPVRLLTLVVPDPGDQSRVPNVRVTTCPFPVSVESGPGTGVPRVSSVSCLTHILEPRHGQRSGWSWGSEPFRFHLGSFVSSLSPWVLFLDSGSLTSDTFYHVFGHLSWVLSKTV